LGGVCWGVHQLRAAVIDFAGRLVLVTGAGRGVGAAYARVIAGHGATVIVHDAGVARDGSGSDPPLPTRWSTKSAPPAARPNPRMTTS